MEKWEAAQTSKNVLTANSDLVHFQVCKSIIISVDQARPYGEVPAPSTYISSTENRWDRNLHKNHICHSGQLSKTRNRSENHRVFK